MQKLINYRLIEEGRQVYVLQQKFAKNLVSMLSSNLKLELKKPKRHDAQISTEDQEVRAKAKW